MPTFPKVPWTSWTPQAPRRRPGCSTRARELAVDLEADAMHAFRARLCFLQLGTDTEVFLFDTLQPGVDAGACSRP